MTDQNTLTPPLIAHPGGPARRGQVLARILDAPRLPTPPVVAMRVVQATARTDSTVHEIAELLLQDPALCASVLKAINSCVYALSEPVSSVERAVLLLGMNTVRSIVLTLSLPAMQFDLSADRELRDHWLSSVSGAIIARELAVRLKLPHAEDDLLCGLLRDLGSLVLRHLLPAEAKRFNARTAAVPFADLCRCEREVYGVDHAEVSAELLQRWRLPEGVCEPIRFHHAPADQTTDDPALAARTRRLAFVEQLANIDVVTQQPAELDALMRTAATDYALLPGDLIEFLQGVVPKVEAFTRLLSIEVGRCPDFAATLAGGCEALVNLTVETGRASVAATLRGSVPPLPGSGIVPAADDGRSLPEFTLELLDEFPRGGCRLDGYELRKMIGRGAMGVVFRAVETSLDRAVAIKLMTPGGGEEAPQYRQRFVREARNAASVRHENVVAIYAVKDTGPHTYLSMELVEGYSLEDAAARREQFAAEEVRALAAQIASGLAAAHAARIVHRDVKPANILIEKATRRAKLTDFGLARGANDVRLTLDGSLIGTPLYMSPEQAAGQPLDARSDLFSLGSVLYTMATGRPPFDGDSMLQVLRLVCDAEPAAPRLIRPELPEWFDVLALKLLAKRKEDRFQTAAEVVEFLNDPEAASGSGTRKRRSGWRALFG